MAKCRNPDCSEDKDWTQGAGYCSQSCRVVTNVLQKTGNFSALTYDKREVADKLMEAVRPGFLGRVKDLRKAIEECRQPVSRLLDL